jgi:hypothetical protein
MDATHMLAGRAGRESIRLYSSSEMPGDQLRCEVRWAVAAYGCHRNSTTHESLHNPCIHCDQCERSSAYLNIRDCHPAGSILMMAMAATGARWWAPLCCQATTPTSTRFMPAPVACTATSTVHQVPLQLRAGSMVARRRSCQQQTMPWQMLQPPRIKQATAASSPSHMAPLAPQTTAPVRQARAPRFTQLSLLAAPQVEISWGMMPAHRVQRTAILLLAVRSTCGS